jgi:hypothetical protein
MKSYIVVVINIRSNFIPCMYLLGVVRYENMYSHPTNYLYLSISMGIEGNLVFITKQKINQKILKNLLYLS